MSTNATHAGGGSTRPNYDGVANGATTTAAVVRSAASPPSAGGGASIARATSAGTNESNTEAIRAALAPRSSAHRPRAATAPVVEPFAIDTPQLEAHYRQLLVAVVRTLKLRGTDVRTIDLDYEDTDDSSAGEHTDATELTVSERVLDAAMERALERYAQQRDL
jgi:hypothetical protein